MCMTARDIEYDPLNDVLFKYIFGADERKHITIDFLNAVLNRDGESAIKEIEFRNVEFVPQREEEKLSRIDIFAILDNNARVDIEVQCVNYKNMEKRSLYYWAQIFLHNNALLTAQDYKIIKPAITINVLDFNFLPSQKPYSMYTLYDAETMHRLTDVIELYFFEVPKFAKKPVKEMNHIEKWLAFFSKKLSKKEKEAVAVTKPAIQAAMDAAGNFIMDDAAYMAYINRQAAILDYNSGIKAAHAEGFEKGLEQGEEKMFQLMNALYKAGRQGEIAKLSSDKTFRENIYKEFNII